MINVSVKLEGLEQTVANLNELSRATQKNVVRRVLKQAGEITADIAASIAPKERGVLAFSIVVATQLTRRHKAEQKNRPSEVEVYIGPSGGHGATVYASFQEFGTVDMPANPFMRPAWDNSKELVLNTITSGLKIQVDKAAARAARKAAKVARA